MNFYKENVKIGKKKYLAPDKKVEMCFNFSILW